MKKYLALCATFALVFGFSFAAQAMEVTFDFEDITPWGTWDAGGFSEASGGYIDETNPGRRYPVKPGSKGGRQTRHSRQPAEELIQIAGYPGKGR